MSSNPCAIQPCANTPPTHLSLILHVRDKIEENHLSLRVVVFVCEKSIILNRNAEFNVAKSAFKLTRRSRIWLSFVAGLHQYPLIKPHDRTRVEAAGCRELLLNSLAHVAYL